MRKPKILAFAGSTREHSWNKKLVKLAASGAKGVGAEVTFIDLRDYPMPLYDEDLEKAHGLSEHAKRLKKLFLENDGFLIASPEYNSTISAVLKNAIDWVSRPVPNEQYLACFSGKVAGIMSASPGGLGGLRGLVTLRSILSNINMIVIPEQIAISSAFEAFDEKGMLKDKERQAGVEKIGEAVAKLLIKILA